MFSPGGCVQETVTVFMNDMAGEYPEGSALYDVEDPNAADTLATDEDEDEGDEAAEDGTDE
jgi:hypothetical protein